MNGFINFVNYFNKRVEDGENLGQRDKKRGGKESKGGNKEEEY